MAQGGRFALSGTVRDASNGESMMGVYVIMTDVNNASNVQGCVTNQAGYYSISSVPGTYKVAINHLGFKTLEDTITLNKNLMRRYELEPSAIEGAEVVIQGERTDRNIASADVGRMEMKIEAIKAMPALMGEADIIKSVQLLPGVQSGEIGRAHV